MHTISFMSANFVARQVNYQGRRVVHVHLKDILAPEPTDPPGKTMKSMGHETCALGKGVVPIQACVASLHKVGYTGAFTIEPEAFDPTEEVKESLTLLRQWLGA